MLAIYEVTNKLQTDKLFFRVGSKPESKITHREKDKISTGHELKNDNLELGIGRWNGSTDGNNKKRLSVDTWGQRLKDDLVEVF